MEETGGAFTDLRSAYNQQRKHASRRGIGFYISFEQWVLWWGPDIWKRGRGDGKLQMCRIKDEGDYELGNIYKSTCNKNSAEKFTNGKNGFRPGLSEGQVGEVRALLAEGVSQREIARRLGTSQRTVNRINKGAHRPVSSSKEK